MKSELLTAKEARQLALDKENTFSEHFSDLLEHIKASAEKGNFSTYYYDEDGEISEREIEQLTVVGYSVEWNAKDLRYDISW